MRPGKRLFVGARMLGLVQLAVLSIATALLLLGAYVWVRVMSPDLEAHRTLKELREQGAPLSAPPSGCASKPPRK